MATVDTLLTAEDLYAMPDDGMRRELIRGRLIEMSPVSGQHGYVVGIVNQIIGGFVREHRLGALVVGDTGIVLERDPDTVRAPDIAYYSAARWAQIADLERYLEVIPNMTIEVVSPNDRRSEVREKAEFWRRSGVQLIWVIDPRQRHQRVTVYQADGSSQIVPLAGELDGEDVLPGFRCAVASLLG